VFFLEIQLDFGCLSGHWRYETTIFKFTLASFMGQNDPLHVILS